MTPASAIEFSDIFVLPDHKPPKQPSSFSSSSSSSSSDTDSEGSDTDDGQSDCDGVEPAPAVASINGYPIGVQQQLNTAMANWAFGAPGVGDGLVAAALPELRVANFFRGYGWHVGTATQDDKGTDVYQVVYDDGDVRDHHRTEIAQMKSDFQDGCHLQH